MLGEVCSYHPDMTTPATNDQYDVAATSYATFSAQLSKARRPLYFHLAKGDFWNRSD